MSIRLTRVLLALILGLALATSLQAPPAQASNASKVKSLIAKIMHSKHPKTTYLHLSKANRALVRKEVKKGHVTTRWVRSSSSTLAVPNSGSSGACWQKTLEADYRGGVTQRTLFTTTNTTKVCVVASSVSDVDVPESFQDTVGLGWHPEGVTDSTLNVDWEGRGVSRGTFSFGAAGWVLFQKTICSQVRLNSDFVHYAGSSKCAVNA